MNICTQTNIVCSKLLHEALQLIFLWQYFRLEKLFYPDDCKWRDSASMSNFMYRTNGDGIMYGLGGGHGMMGAMMGDHTASFEYQYLAQMKAFISKAYKSH